MTRARDMTAALVAELEAHGATEIEREITGGAHQVLRFKWRGRERSFFYPFSPSDGQRATKNALTELRKVLGVKRIITKSGKPKQRKLRGVREPVKVPRLKHIPPKPHPFEKLKELME